MTPRAADPSSRSPPAQGEALPPLHEEPPRVGHKRPARPGAKPEATQESTHASDGRQGEKATAPGGTDELLAGGGAGGVSGAGIAEGHGEGPDDASSPRVQAPKPPKTAHGGTEGLAPKNQSGQGGEAA